jgi:hypothetical protein
MASPDDDAKSAIAQEGVLLNPGLAIIEDEKTLGLIASASYIWKSWPHVSKTTHPQHVPTQIIPQVSLLLWQDWHLVMTR